MRGITRLANGSAIAAAIAVVLVLGATAPSIHAALLTEDEYIECNESALYEGDYYLACEFANSPLGWTYQIFMGYAPDWPSYANWNSFWDEYWNHGYGVHNGQWDTVGSDGVAVMQGDGNFVLYNEAFSGAAWETGTYGNPGAYLNLQSDSNMVIYSSSNVPLWSLW